MVEVMSRCKMCGGELTPPKGPSRPKIFCDSECKNAFHNGRKPEEFQKKHDTALWEANRKDPALSKTPLQAFLCGR